MSEPRASGGNRLDRAGRGEAVTTMAGGRGWSMRRGRFTALPVALAVLAAWMLSPALTAVHVEGFTAQIQISAIAANAGLIDRANLTFPLHTEYFYLTRLGTVYLLQALMWLSGKTGDGVFHVLVVISFVAFVWATLAVARAVASVGWLAGAMALLLTPGVAELGFYFQDSVVSAAFGMGALAVLTPRCALADIPARKAASASLLAGALLGFAIICRTDAVLLMPVLAGFVWLKVRSWRELLLPAGLVSVAILVVFAASYAVSGTTVFQAVRTASFFDGLHVGFRHYSVLATAFGLFFGVPMLLLLPVRMVRACREYAPKQVVVLVALPLLLLGYMALHSLEVRQFYPLLAPFIAIHGGRGLEMLWASLKRTPGAMHRRFGQQAAIAWMAVTLLVWLAPPVLVPVTEGPRPPIGRLWSPLLWFEWQSAVAGTLDDVTRLVRRAGELPRIAVISTNSDTEHYLRLRMWQAGFESLRATEIRPGCVGGFEAWRVPGHELLLVRTENPHLMVQQHWDYTAALQIQRAFQCPGLFEATPTYVSDQGWHDDDDAVMRYLVAAHPELAQVGVTFGWPKSAVRWVRAHLSRHGLDRGFGYERFVNRTALLTTQERAGLEQVVGGVVAAGGDATQGPAPGYDAYVALFATRFWHPRETARP